MKHLFAIILVLALFIPAQRPSCTMRTAANGRVICVCSGNRAGRMAWRSVPTFVCEVWR